MGGERESIARRTEEKAKGEESSVCLGGEMGRKVCQHLSCPLRMPRLGWLEIHSFCAVMPHNPPRSIAINTIVTLCHSIIAINHNASRQKSEAGVVSNQGAH